MEQEWKQEYMERLTRELFSEAVGEAVKYCTSGANPDKLKDAAFEAYNAVLELGMLSTDY